MHRLTNNQYEIRNRHIRKTLFWILGLLLLGSLMVYGLNNQLSRSAYYFFVLIFLVSSKDKILTASVLFILILYPWGLFYTAPYDIAIRITSTAGIKYYTLLSLGFIIKYLFSVGFKAFLIKDYFKPYYTIFGFYFIFLIIFGIVFGYNISTYYNLFVSTVVLSLFLIFTRIFDYQSAVHFNRIIFAFSIILTIVSLVDVMLSGRIVEALVFRRGTRTLLIQEGGLTRLFGGIRISFYTIIIAIFYLISRRGYFKTWYLWLVVFASFILIVNTGTRGWILAAGIIILISTLYYYKDVLLTPRIIIGALVLISVVGLFTPSSVKRNMSYSYERFMTIEKVLEGDLTTGGTTGRFTERGPRVLTRFNESPVFGFGFSKVSAEFYDNHVGNHTLLLTSGIVGTSIIWGTTIFIVFFIFRLERASANYRGVFVFGIAIIAIMIIHSTNEIMISFFNMPVDSAILWAMIFNQINTLIFVKQKSHSHNRSLKGF